MFVNLFQFAFRDAQSHRLLFEQFPVVNLHLPAAERGPVENRVAGPEFPR